MCIIRGCKNKPPPLICDTHWRQLPASMKRRWWRETNYTGLRPARELIRDVNRAIEKRRKNNNNG